MEQQKIIQIGNSIGITIPKELAQEMSLKVGSVVELKKDVLADAISIGKPGKKTIAVSSAFLDILERVNKQYGPALRELATK
jgi:antitoxin component of MazEF toxin-antitoxin module